MIARDRLGMEQTAQHTFLHALGHRPEQRIDGVVVEHTHRQDGLFGVVRHPVGGGEGNDDLAGAVAAERAGAGQAHQRPVAEPPQLALTQGDVRRQHRDDGALVLVGRDVGIQQALDGGACHYEVIEDGVVGEHQRTDGVLFPVQLHHTGGRADAALQAVAAHSPARAHSALGEIGAAVGQRGPHIFFRDVEAPDVVEAAVVALADHRVDAAGRLADVGVLIQHILHQRCLHSTYAEGIGEEDGRFQRPQLVDLDKAGGLAEAVDDMAGRHHFIVENIALMGQQRGHAGLDLALRQCAVAHRHARHIAYLVQRPAGQFAHPDAPALPFCFDSHKYPPCKNAPSSPDGEG